MLQAPKKRVAAVPAGVKKVCTIRMSHPRPPLPLSLPVSRSFLRAGAHLPACFWERRRITRRHLPNLSRLRRAQAPAATKAVNPLFEKRPKTFGACLATFDKLAVPQFPQMVHRRRSVWCKHRPSATKLCACCAELSNPDNFCCRRRRGAAAEAGPAPFREVAEVCAHPAAAAGAEPAAEGAAGAQPLHQDAGQEHSADALQAAPQVQVSVFVRRPRQWSLGLRTARQRRCPAPAMVASFTLSIGLWHHHARGLVNAVLEAAVSRVRIGQHKSSAARRPEDKAAKKERLLAEASAREEGKEVSSAR